MWYTFLLYNKVNRLCIYIYPLLSNLPPTPYPTPLGHHRAVLLIVQPYFERNCFQTPQANKSSTFWWWICAGQWVHSNSHTTIFYFPSFSLTSPGAREVWVASGSTPVSGAHVQKHLLTGTCQELHQAPYSCHTSWNSLFNPMLIHWLIHWLIQIQLQVNRTTAPLPQPTPHMLCLSPISSL